MSLSGSESKEKSLPKFVEQDFQQALDYAQDVSSVGYVPYYGPDIAGYSPMQKAAFEGTNAMAGAFGMPTADNASYLPETQTFAGGVQGYSSAPMFEEAKAALAQNRPGQAGLIDSFFVNPVTGEAGANMASVRPVKYQTSAKRGK